MRAALWELNQLDEWQNGIPSHESALWRSQAHREAVRRGIVQCRLDELTGFKTRKTAEDAVVRMRAESRLHQQFTVSKPWTISAVHRRLLPLQLSTYYTLQHTNISYSNFVYIIMLSAAEGVSPGNIRSEYFISVTHHSSLRKLSIVVILFIAPISPSETNYCPNEWIIIIVVVT